MIKEYNGSGSRRDALRHAYWMALLSRHIGPKRALWLGEAHEKKNRKDFEKGILEDESMADVKNEEMDLSNNIFGAKIGKYCKKCSDEELLETTIEALKKGELFIIKHNVKGQFLDQAGQVINKEDWWGKWENKRVLVSSDFGL